MHAAEEKVRKEKKLIDVSNFHIPKKAAAEFKQVGTTKTTTPTTARAATEAGEKTPIGTPLPLVRARGPGARVRPR